MVAVLTLANASAFIDRQILGLLVAPIRRDLGIGDAEMGVLYGLAFAAFYTLLGLPVARLADRGSRRLIIGVGIAVWSVMTALSGLARSYDELLLARFGVGIGEAALAAPAASLLADYFPSSRRATALSVYSLGIYLGAGLANLVGGAVIARLGEDATIILPLAGSIRAWQAVFVVVGVPGLLIAALMATVREPARREVGRIDATGHSVRDVFAYIRDNTRTFVSHNLGYALLALVNYGTAAWLPTHLIRTYGWSAAEAGITLGTLTITVGVAGIIVGGRVADAMLARGRTDAKLRVGIIAAVANLVFGLIYTLAPTASIAVAALVPFNFFASFAFGAAVAAVQEIVPNRMRAQAAALYVTVTTLVGLGLGPSIVGVLTEQVFGADSAVRYSLAILTVAGLAASAVLLAIGLAPYRRSVAYRDAWMRSPTSGTR
ncbi:MAG: Permease of the major facilitator superfamily [Geminicoccaceae bacterium]|nr:Permease of the major facilitator superfamily [Geminicoccaceae bacterium]